MKKNIFLFLLCCSAVLVQAQDDISLNGWHLGVTTQAEFIGRSHHVTVTGTERAPVGRITYGGETCMEASYHFAKFFGVAVGIGIGTGATLRERFWQGTLPDGNGGSVEINQYNDIFMPLHETELFMPLHFEFHFPIGKNFYFTSEIGGQLKGFFHGCRYNVFSHAGAYIERSVSMLDCVRDYGQRFDTQTPDETYQEEILYRTPYHFTCDLQMALGAYYRLRRGDLLRLTAGINKSFQNEFEGYFRYCQGDTRGSVSVRHDYFFVQFAYIHCFKTKQQKAERKSSDSGLK